MFRTRLYVGVWFLLMCSVVSLSAQQAVLATANAVVPRVVKLSGVLTDASSKSMTGKVGVTFSLYKDSQGGAALWVETQNVTLDKTGHYTAILGSTTSQGLPADVFASGEARWLGVQAQGEAEQPRTVPDERTLRTESCRCRDHWWPAGVGFPKGLRAGVSHG